MRTPAASSKPEDLLARLGERVRAARTQRSLGRAELASRAGISLRFLAQLETGTANISLLRLHEVAQALGVELGELVAGSARERPGASAAAVPGDLAELLAGRTAAELAEVRAWLGARFAVERGSLVALLGLRGAGKSTVGRRLAQKLRVPFYELDALIERSAGLPLAQIFELHGEQAYRRQEREALVRFLAATPAGVLATGGGLVTDAETFALLRGRCTTVWLHASAEDHWQRVVRQGDRRPMRGHPGAMQELRALLAARGPLYAQSHLRVETSGRSVAAVAEALATRLGVGAGGRRTAANGRGRRQRRSG